jgi:hypothetical protein
MVSNLKQLDLFISEEECILRHQQMKNLYYVLCRIVTVMLDPEYRVRVY